MRQLPLHSALGRALRGHRKSARSSQGELGRQGSRKAFYSHSGNSSVGQSWETPGELLEALGQVIIHKQDGTIQTEYTYGDDPSPPAG